MLPIPLYRLQGHGDHFYTTSAAERDNAIAEYGYASEGVACYVYATAEPVPPPIDPDLLQASASVLASMMCGRYHAGVYVGDPKKQIPCDVAIAVDAARQLLAALR